MNPYAEFNYFGLLLYVIVPTLVLGLLGRLRWPWTLFWCGVAAALHFSPFVTLPGSHVVRELWLAIGYAAIELLVAIAFVRHRSRGTFYAALALTILPLALAKFLPLFAPKSEFGFLGISYVTFRALDVIFSIHDGVLKSLSPTTWLGYVFFFPTISSGPIDRYRRFEKDWLKTRTRAEFLDDLDFAVSRLFRGFLYKFIIAALIATYCTGPLNDPAQLVKHWTEVLAKNPGPFAAYWIGFLISHIGPLTTWAYMYAYTFYLFFDFAGYSAFAIAVSRLFGIASPENFDRPFLSRNIRDFWNRWHISLSFWFRDHVYMRFLIAAMKGKWFAGKHTSSYIGLFLTFGLMGVWHGPTLHYMVYGLYHATLLSCYDAFARWNKTAKRWGDGRVQTVVDGLLTFHAIAFGMLLFSGRLIP